MKIQPYRLSQISMGDFTLVGYSVAGEESIIIVPELDVCFDIGKCPREALAVNHVLLTHGHADHSAGLLYYFAQRDFQGIENGLALVPERLLDATEDLLHAWGRFEGHVPPYQLEAMKPGKVFEIRRGLEAIAFSTPHVPGSLGYALVDVRHKLKEEYFGLDGPGLVALKKQGVEITRRVDVPLVAYLGDTAKGNFAALPFVRDARALLVECTFFDDDHTARARAGRHMHIDDLAAVLAGMNNERIIITHVTRRTNLTTARKLLKQALPDETLKKVTFLMSRQHLAEE
jgi:ribonuclease Z